LRETSAGESAVDRSGELSATVAAALGWRAASVGQLRACEQQFIYERIYREDLRIIVKHPTREYRLLRIVGAGPGKRLVAIVDDDESVRHAVHGVLRSVGLNAQTFTSAEEFLASGQPDEVGCLVTDVQMPGMTGLELQARLAEDNIHIPTIFITAYGNASMRAQAMRAGAVEFLGKPFDDDVLLESVRAALDM
jgi:CheY-like chemotaxis protein